MSSIVDTTHGGKAKGYMRSRGVALSHCTQPSSTISMLSRAIAEGVKDWDGWWQQRLQHSLARLSDNLGNDGQLHDDATDALIAVMHSTAWMLSHFKAKGKEGDAHRIGAAMLAEDLIRLTWEGDQQKSRMAASAAWKWTGWQRVRTEVGEGLEYRPAGMRAETAWDEPSMRRGRDMAFTVSHDPDGVLSSDDEESIEEMPVVKLDPTLIAGTLSLAQVLGNREQAQARKLRQHARELLREATESTETTLRLTTVNASERFKDADAAHATLQTLHTAARALLLTGVSDQTLAAAAKLQGESLLFELKEHMYPHSSLSKAMKTGMWTYTYSVDESKKGAARFDWATRRLGSGSYKHQSAHIKEHQMSRSEGGAVAFGRGGPSTRAWSRGRVEPTSWLARRLEYEEERALRKRGREESDAGGSKRSKCRDGDVSLGKRMGSESNSKVTRVKTEDADEITVKLADKSVLVKQEAKPLQREVSRPLRPDSTASDGSERTLRGTGSLRGGDSKASCESRKSGGSRSATQKLLRRP